jgi:long-chain fatty acid transport protein
MMRRMRVARSCPFRGWGLALLAPCLVATASAQTNDEVQTATQFNFSTPGARSLGLGGAFLALADDATAAYANPAGLTQLAAPEVSLEGRAFAFTSRFPARGHAPETGVTGIGIDTVGGIEERRRTDQTKALSFLSYAHSGRRWAVAAYRHQVAAFAASLDSQGVFVGERDRPQRLAPVRSRLSLDIENYGVAAALRLGHGVALGAGVAYSRFALSSRTARFHHAERTGDFFTDSLTGNFFGPADFLPGNVLNTQTQEGDDSGLAWTLGARWQIDSRWSVGAVLREAPAFDFRAVFTQGPAGDDPGRVEPDLGGSGAFSVPDVRGVGVAFHPFDELVIAFDWNRVEYSDMSDQLINLLRVGRGERRLFRAEDADELHLGLEYQWIQARLPVSFRLGGWLDPDHRIRYLGDNEALRARFRAGRDEVHLAGGIGVVLARAQIDVAADLSDSADTLSLSAIARF